MNDLYFLLLLPLNLILTPLVQKFSGTYETSNSYHWPRIWVHAFLSICLSTTVFIRGVRISSRYLNVGYKPLLLRLSAARCLKLYPPWTRPPSGIELQWYLGLRVTWSASVLQDEQKCLINFNLINEWCLAIRVLPIRVTWSQAARDCGYSSRMLGLSRHTSFV
jgi:hypothetical protein